MAKKIKASEDITPLIAYEAQGSEMRRNAAATQIRTDRFALIEQGLTPFRFDSYAPGNSYMDVREAVILCQLAYYNFAVIRNVIDLMTEFSVGEIHYKGGNKRSRDFFSALFKKINILDLQDKFYREYYRSGNVFLHRFDATIKPNDVQKIIQTFACENMLEIDKATASFDQEQGMYDILKTDLKTNEVGKMDYAKNMLPTRYIILNPADIRIMGTSNFACGVYFKILSDFELTRLRNPMSEEDVQVYNSLPADAQKQIKVGARTVIIPLNPHKILMVFYKKQDYEPFAVPMGWPVLEDINAKQEMKQIDMAIARTMQQSLLLVTQGEEPDKGGINQNAITKLTKMMANRSVSRTIVADWTVKASWVIPDIADILTASKYEQLDKDINVGLNNVFMGGEKFANQSQRVELFVARLEFARQQFLNGFLYQEIKRLSRNLGFKSFPTPYYEDIKLKDNTQIQKLYERLMEVGLLTPEQGFDAIKNNSLPDPTTFTDEQQEYADQRKNGLFQPLIGGGQQGQMGNGRPPGTGIPQTTKNITPIGKSKASVNEEEREKYGLLKIKETLILAEDLNIILEKKLKKKYKIKKLTEEQSKIKNEIANVIIANEESKDWLSKTDEYIESPIDKNKERVNKVLAIAKKHELEESLASILYSSKVE